MTRTLTVAPGQPGAYPSISDALEVAGDDSVISIAAGTFIESLRLDGRRVTLAAADPGRVIIDAQTLGAPAVHARDGAVTLRGLTLYAGDTAAVAISGGSVEIENCELRARFGAGLSLTDRATVQTRELSVTGGQYGLLIEESGGLIERCQVRDVTDDGIIVRLGADPVIRDTTINGCGYRGVYIYQSSAPTLERCEISETGAAGISVAHQSSPTIRECWLHDLRGVGIFVGRSCKGLIEECTVEGTATPAIQVEDGAHPTIVEPRPTGPRARSATSRWTGPSSTTPTGWSGCSPTSTR